MKPIRFLPFLAACLGLGAATNAAVESLPGDRKERLKFRHKRDKAARRFMGFRFSFNRPHLGAQDAIRLLRRDKLDAHAAALNYPGWCGRTEAGSSRVN